MLIESFPVFEPGKDKPLRKHEPLGRYITTPIFDKNSSGRTLSDGKAYYRPKRDTNGIIMCRSQKDQEACIFADKVRILRQREYDEVDWSETSSYKQGLTRHWTEMFSQDMTISQALMEPLTLAAGGRVGISTGGGGYSSELTNWDGTKKKTGWGM